MFNVPWRHVCPRRDAALFPPQPERTRKQVVRCNCAQANRILAVSNAGDGRRWHGSGPRVHQRKTLRRPSEVVRPEARRHLTLLRFIPSLPSLALLLAYPAEPKPASSPNVNSSEVHLRPTRLPAFQHAGRTHWHRGSTTRCGTGCALRSCRAAPPSPGDPISCSSHSRAMYAGALPHASACQRRRSAPPLRGQGLLGPADRQDCLRFQQPVFPGLPDSGLSPSATFGDLQQTFGSLCPGLRCLPRQSFFLMGQEVLTRHRIPETRRPTSKA